MNKILPIVLLLLLPFMGSAQDQNVALNHKTAAKNSFSLQTGTFHYFVVKEQNGGPFNFLGANYNRLLNKRLSIYTQFMYQFGENDASNDYEENWKTFDYDRYDEDRYSIRTSGKNYSFWDLGIQYLFYEYKDVSFSANLGVSAAEGTRIYMQYVYDTAYYNGFLYPYSHSVEKLKRETIFGGTLGLAAHYSFMDDRFTVGSSITARRYFAQYFPFQLNFGVHIGVNF